MIKTLFADQIFHDNRWDLVEPWASKMVEDMYGEITNTPQSYTTDPSPVEGFDTPMGWWWRNNQIFKDTISKEAEAWLLKSLKEYFFNVLQHTLYQEEYLFMHYIWPVVITTGSYVVPHIHRGAGNHFISGGLCLRASEGHALTFHSPRSFFSEPFKLKNMANSNEVGIPVKSGDLLFWKSDAIHEIKQNNTTEPLVFIGFDVGLFRPHPPEHLCYKIESYE